MGARYLKWLPVVQEQLCTGCGRCAEGCPGRALQMVEGTVALLYPGACFSEADCVAACPEQAITMKWVELAEDKNRGKWRAEVDIFTKLKSYEK